MALMKNKRAEAIQPGNLRVLALWFRQASQSGAPLLFYAPKLVKLFEINR